ncbi:MAG: radical SAM protein [Desulfuromonadales bacterium]|nr:radical SAM protein [Desulfuromonadales bacterium]
MKLLIIENPRPLTFEHYNDVANAPLSASLNSGYALAVARRAGWTTAHLDFTSGTDNPETISAAILAEGADLILLHWVYAWGHESTVRSVLELLKRGGSCTIGAFGLFPTLSRTRLMQYALGLDFILIGEFEDTLAELLNGFGPGTLKPLPGLALRDLPFVPRPLPDDLSLLPVPDDVGSNLAYSTLNIAASRGCYGDCSFCFIKPYYGCSRRRVRDLASLEQELETRLSRRAVASLYFIDPTFLAPGQQEHQRTIAISRVAQAAGLPFGFETRVDTVEETLLTTLAKNGATSVFLGIESGCDSVLRRIGKRITSEQISRAVQVVQGCGLQLNIGFIMFEPDTTLAELEENYTFLDGLGLLAGHELTANLLYHNQIVLHGSPAWQRFEGEKRLLLDERLPFEARYRFKDERVGRVCDAMGRLSSEYFHGLERLRQAAGDECDSCGCSTAASSHVSLPGDQLNALLKGAFLAFCAASGELPPQGFCRVEERYLGQLRKMLA